MEAGELWGETEHDHVWTQLSGLLSKAYRGRMISRLLVDSGFKPGGARAGINQIYRFCRIHKGRAFPCKGHDRQDKPLRAARIDVSVAGRIVKGGLQLWHLDSDYFKSWVHARIEWPAGEPGAFHLHAEATVDYCQQLVAEQRLVKASGRVTWIKTSRDNHFLDCEALNVAAAHILGVHTLKAKTPDDKVTNKQIYRPASARQRGWINTARKGSWVREWRE